MEKMIFKRAALLALSGISFGVMAGPTWQRAAAIPVVAEGAACNSATDKIGVSSGNTMTLYCQSGVWAKSGANTCPSGSTYFPAYAMCVSTPGTSKDSSVLDAMIRCAAAGMTLPDAGELWTIRSLLGSQPEFWSSSAGSGTSNYIMLDFNRADNTPLLNSSGMFGLLKVVCVKRG